MYFAMTELNSENVAMHWGSSAQMREASTVA
ncbi:hypothetical protein BH09MYX1_BH09MYX1_54890 [soil metagenome]